MEIHAVGHKGMSEAAEKILSAFPEERIFTLKGTLGAGKTTLVQALAQKLGVKEAVTSPSFALIQQYFSQASTEQTIYHIDLYRLRNRDEALHIGLEEHLDSISWCFIEWPEIIEDILEKYPHVEIDIEIMPDASRKIRILKR